MYLDLLSKVLTNKIYEPDSPKATPDEVDEIKKTLDLLMNDGINLNISAEDLTQILQYTKRSREGANKSYGTRAFTGNPLILND